jgi:hypothetical protein
VKPERKETVGIISEVSRRRDSERRRGDKGYGRTRNVK